MASTRTGMPRGITWGLIVGVFLLIAAFGNGSWLTGLAGAAVLAVVGRILYLRNLDNKKLIEPWPWPADLRAGAEGLARPIDPTPKRLLPPHENASLVAHVASTQESLSRLIADKPAAWPWAVFASVLVLRRNAVQARLRTVASGYQPRQGIALSGQAYSQTALGAMRSIADTVTQIEQFMLSPAFTGAFGESGEEKAADADAIVGIANRLMDYHQTLLTQAELCLQTPVASDVMVFVHDAGAVALMPLVGYDDFIETMCVRIGEAQDLLPYGDRDTVIQLDDVSLSMTLPDDLSERLFAQIKRFNT